MGKGDGGRRRGWTLKVIHNCRLITEATLGFVITRTGMPAIFCYTGTSFLIISFSFPFYLLFYSLEGCGRWGVSHFTLYISHVMRHVGKNRKGLFQTHRECCDLILIFLTERALCCVLLLLPLLSAIELISMWTLIRCIIITVWFES